MSWENIEEVIADLSFVKLQIRKAPTSIFQGLEKLGEYVTTVGLDAVWILQVVEEERNDAESTLTKVLVQDCLSSVFSHFSSLQAPEIQGTEILSYF